MGRLVRKRICEKPFAVAACRWGFVICAAWSFVEASTAMAADEKGAGAAYTQRVRPILQKYCFDCHGEKTAKNGLRLDTLAADFRTAKTVATWKEVMGRVADRSEDGMPPKGKPQPSADEIKALREWIADKLTTEATADAADQKAQGRAQLRRLNRVEFNNTLRDLLGIDVDLKPLLPDDDVVAGFDNVGSGLQITRIHQERYLEAAEAALNAAIVLSPRPKTTKVKLAFRKDGYPPRQVLEDGAVAFLTSATAELQQSRASALGQYRIRISCYPYRNQGRPLIVYVNCGNPVYPDERYCAVAADKPAVVEFVARMAPGNTVRIAPYGFGVNYIKDLAAYKGPGLAIESVEIEGPLTDTWPPESHQRLLGKLDLKKADLAGAEQVLRAFIPRAFRRPVPDDKVKKFVDFLRAKVADGNNSVEDALRQALMAVLCAPDFLMLYEAPGPLDDFALAARLSYFLWRSMPDQQLIDLAAQKKLHSPDELRRQVERMLQDPKAAALAEQFLGQWLALRQIDATTPDRMLYPEFDDYLKYSMLKEPQLFFEEMLKNDLKIQCLIDADFSILNERLARHYGIEGVEGPEFRRVKLPPDCHRGGVLTMAAVLKVTANGTVTSPVLRGAWLLDKIMGQPLQLPSDLNVPAVEPDIRGARNIRDQLAKHRTVAQCSTCHQKIDPLGFALENFDPIGGQRTNYRALGKYPKANVKVHGKPVDYSPGLAVQAGDKMPNGKPFKDSDEFKKILLEESGPIIRTVAEKLVVYATGSPIRPADRVAVDGILQRVRDKNDGLRTLVHELVQSELFLNK
jgi:mono/diheme cytochrome c family protein